MTTTTLIGIAAGLCAALLFAAAAYGTVPLRAALILVTGLPLAVAALGWGSIAAIIAAIAGTLVLAALAHPVLAMAFLTTHALPLVWLGYLAGLSRVAPSVPSAGSASTGDGVEWYPPGRIVVWAAIIAAVLACSFMLLLGDDMDAIRKAVRGFVEEFAAKQFPELSGGKAMSAQDISDLADIALQLLPAAMAISILGTLLFNVWLAGRVAQAAGVLRRPWPDLPALTYPTGTPLLLAVATAGTFLPGLLGSAAAALFGAMFLAYLLLGLAVVHFVTRGHPWRPFALWGIYGGLIVFNTLASLMFVLLGLADTIRSLRSQPPGAPRGPPSRPDTLT